MGLGRFEQRASSVRSRTVFCLFSSVIKMAAPTEFTLEAVRKFMIEKGGKVTNHELVKHFKIYLTNPDSRGEY